MDLVLIRHLPTEWNKKGLLQGNRDISIEEISDEVLERINENKKVLQTIVPFDLVLTSTLIRTQQTAKAYGYDQFEIEPLLNELDFGKFEGVEKKRLLEENNWIHNPREMVLGESLIVFEQRIVTFLKKYKKRKNILIFGHGSWIRALLSIEKFGHIGNMNKITVENNVLIQVKECIHPLKNSR